MTAARRARGGRGRILNRDWNSHSDPEQRPELTLIGSWTENRESSQRPREFTERVRARGGRGRILLYIVYRQVF